MVALISVLTSALLMLTTVGMPVPAAAATGVPCAGPAQNGLTITPTHDPTFYVDLPDFDASYLGYKIDNSGVARSNLWVAVGEFTGGSVSLDEDGDNRAQIPSLPAGGTDSAFFMVKASSATSTAQAHDVTVYDRRPDLAGASVIAACTFSFAAVASTIAANANQVNAVTSTPAAPALGQTVTMVVDGKTGQANGAVWVSPAANASWPSKALRLEQTRIEVNVDGVGPIEQTFVDTLYIPGAIASVYTSKTTYRARYTFRATQALTTSPTMKPVAQISSGGQFKHTGSYPTLPVVSVSSTNAGVIAGKTITATDLSVLPTTTSPNGLPGAITYAEVPYRITASATGADASVDELVDVPDAGVLFKNGSARITDATPRVNDVLGDPLTSAADTGVLAGALHFTGPFPVSTTIPITLTYVMYVPVIQDTYTNEAFAAVNSTVLGSGPNLVPIVTVTTDGTGVTGFTEGNAGTGTTTQTILFDPPADRAADATGFPVAPTASSGLPVSVVSTTPGVCSVTAGVVDVHSAGTCTLVAVQFGDGTYAAADPVTVSFQATLVPQSITLPTPAHRAVTAADFEAGATSDSGLAVHLASSTPSVCVISDGLVDVLTAGICSLVGTQPGTDTYAAATPVEVSFQVTMATQTIVFDPISDRGVDAADFTVSPSASSGLPVAITSSTPTVCSVTAAGVVDVLTVGTCTLTATQTGDTTYAAAHAVDVSFEVTKDPQSIDFPIPADRFADSADFEATPVASSGLPVTVTSDTPEVCTVTAGVVDVLTAGVCTLVATQAGDSTYAAADPTVVSFDVLPVVQEIALPTPGTMVPTGDPFTVSPTSDSGLPVTVTSSTPDICTVTGGLVTLTGEEGTCTLVATQPGDEIYGPAPAVDVSFTVGRVTQTITFGLVGDLLVNADDFTVTPTSTSGLPVTVTSTTPSVCTVVDGVVDVLTDGVCTLTATQPGDATFVAADAVSVWFTVTRAPQVLTFPAIADRALTAGDLTVAPTSDSGLPVVVTSDTPTVCTVVAGLVSFTGVEGVCTLTATQAGDATHLPTSAARSFLVARAWQGIVFPTPTDRDMTAVDFPVTPSASSGLPVTVTSTTPTVCSVTGGVVDVLTPGVCHLAGTQPGNAQWLPAEPVEVQFTITKAAQTVTFPPVPGRTSTDGPFPITGTATSGLPLVFTSSTPDICTVADGVVTLTGTPGTCTLVADQPGDATWLPGEQVVRFFTVAAPTPTTPTTPTDPGVPTTPTDPGVPTTPTDPGVPTTPTDPRIPSTPTTPTVPTQTGTTAGPVTVTLPGVPGGTTIQVPATVPGAKTVTTAGTAVTVTPTRDFSGVITVPVTLIGTDGTTTTTSVVITVNPQAPKKGVAQNRSINHSKLVWAKSATGSVTMYVVTIDGEVVCRTTKTSCTPTHLVNRGSVIKVVALGNGGTRSQEIRLDYRKKLVLAAVVHFPTSQWNLTADQRKIVTDTRAKSIKYGLTHMTVTGDTDSRGSKAYNKRLSAKRAAIVVKELRRGGVKLQLGTRPRGEDTPTASNRTAVGMYANRRAEIWVW